MQWDYVLASFTVTGSFVLFGYTARAVIRSFRSKKLHPDEEAAILRAREVYRPRRRGTGERSGD